MPRAKSPDRVSRPKTKILHLPPLDMRRAVAGFDSIELVDDFVYNLVAAQAPDLMDKLPSKRPPAKSVRRPAKRSTSHGAKRE